MNIKLRLLLFLICITVVAPVLGADSLIISADTSTILMRLPDPSNLEEYKGQKAFNYAQTDNTGFLARSIPQWLKSFLRDLHMLVSSFGDFELFIIIVLALIFTAIILKVNDIDPVSLFRHRNKHLPPPFESVHENLKRLDFRLMIAQAVEAGDYRLAVRYHYLQALSLLAMKGKIQLKEEKTNREYIAEMGSGDLKENFVKLVYGFEFVWYGEFIPDEKLYLQLDSAFLSFNKMLQV